MDVRAFLEEYDRLSHTKTEAELESLLKEACLTHESEEPGDLLGKAALYNELGSFYRGHKRLKDAESAFLKAKSILEGYDKSSEVNTPWCTGCVSVQIGYEPELRNCTENINYATILNNLAGLYRMQGEMNRSLDLFEKAEALYETLSNVPDHILASCYNNKGLVYLDMGKSVLAETCFYKALDLITDTRENAWMYATTLNNLAFVFAVSGKHDCACSTFLDAAAWFQKSGKDGQKMAGICLSMADKQREKH